MPTSRAGSRGFTLLELLVTLAIIAVVTALAAPAIAERLLNPPPGARSARLIKGLLGEARASAAAEGQAVAVLWAPEARRFTLTPVQGPGPEVRGLRRRSLEIPGEVEVSVNGFAPVADAPEGSGPVEGVLFFPLGGSTGGSVAVRAADEAVTLRVDRLTGEVQEERSP